MFFIFLQRASLIPVGSTDPKIANRDLRNQTQMSLPSHVPALKLIQWAKNPFPVRSISNL